MDAPLPDYYAVLGVRVDASPDEIRTAYKRASLASHPDRFPHASAQQRAAYTARFQSLADAYYVLSEPSRRSEYDGLRKKSRFSSSRSNAGAGSYGAEAWERASTDDGGMPGDFYEKAEEEQGESANFFRSFFGAAASAAGAGAGASSNDSSASREGSAQPEAQGIFGDVFAELLRPEVERVVPIWKWIGAASGAGLGFILANVPGLIGGAVLGNRLGAVRDAKGKSVVQVFSNLGADQKAEVLRALAAKIFSPR